MEEIGEISELKHQSWYLSADKGKSQYSVQAREHNTDGWDSSEREVHILRSGLKAKNLYYWVYVFLYLWYSI